MKIHRKNILLTVSRDLSSDKQQKANERLNSFTSNDLSVKKKNFHNTNVYNMRVSTYRSNIKREISHFKRHFGMGPGENFLGISIQIGIGDVTCITHTF